MKISPDGLTPKERMDLYFAGQEVDRLPCLLYFEDTAPSYAGISLKNYYFSADLIVDVESYMLQKFGLESISIGPTLNGIAEAAGSKLLYNDNHLSMVLDPILDQPGRLESLALIDPYCDGRLPVVLQALGRLQKKFAATHPVGSGIAGPVTTAAALRGTSQLLKDFIRNPGFVTELLDYANQCLLAYVKAVYNEFGIVCDISEPVLSQDICGLNHFKTYGKKALKQLADGIVAITGVEPTLHICGKTKNLWQDLADLPISGFSLDNCESLFELKQVLGRVMNISGNVAPIQVIKDGGRQEIFEAVRQGILEASDSLLGYLVSGGCQIPMGVETDNILAVAEATRLYSQGAKMGLQACNLD